MYANKGAIYFERINQAVNVNAISHRIPVKYVEVDSIKCTGDNVLRSQIYTRYELTLGKHNFRYAQHIMSGKLIGVQRHYVTTPISEPQIVRAYASL